jgi:hypothetical protein
MKERCRTQLNRRAALKIAAGLAAASSALGQPARIASAHDLRPTDPAYEFEEYEWILNHDVHRPDALRVADPRQSDHLQQHQQRAEWLPILIRSPPGQIQVVVQAYATANLAMYDDELSAKYRLGEIFRVQDPTTGEPSVRNLWFASKHPAPAEPPADRSNPFYSDLSIEELQRRGVLFLI